jgi:hypothetical protein
MPVLKAAAQELLRPRDLWVSPAARRGLKGFPRL